MPSVHRDRPRRDLLRILARADEEIRERVTRLLRFDERTETARCDSVENGIVTLSGLPDPMQRRAAVAIVQGVAGVSGIVLADL
jgi:osmotically-inducible protein OsmY